MKQSILRILLIFLAGPLWAAPEIVTEYETPKQQRVYILYNNRVIRSEVLNAGTRVQIGIDPGQVVPPPPPPPPPLTLSSFSVPRNVLLAGDRLTATLTLSRAPAAPVAVTVSGNDPLLTVPASVSFAANQTAATFEIAAGNVPPGTTRNVTVTATYNGARSVALALQGLPTPPPPPPPDGDPIITGFRNEQGIATTVFPSGALVIIEGQGFGANPGSVNLGVTAGVVRSWNNGEIRTQAPLVTPQLYYGVPVAMTPYTVTVTREDGKSYTLTNGIQVTPLEPPPPNRISVRDHGAVPDDGKSDRIAIQAAILAATAGTTVWFPAGRYDLDDSVKVFKVGGIAFAGESRDAVTIKVPRGIGFQLGTGGQPYTGLSVRDLTFEGLPGRYRADGNDGQLIQLYGPKGTVIERCRFVGGGTAVFNAGIPGQTYGTVIRDCEVIGWGVIGFFLNGGEVIERCRLFQDDPAERLERSSHGIYIHSGASDITVKDVEIANARKYAIQLYGQDPGTFIDNVTLTNLSIRNCANGLTIQQSAPDRARVRNLRVDNLLIHGTYGGPALSIKQGDNMVFRGVDIDNRPGSETAGIQIGVWAPYENTGFWISDLQILGGVVKNAHRGFWAMQSFGGEFRNVRVAGVEFAGNKIPIHFEPWFDPATNLDVPVQGVTIDQTPVVDTPARRAVERALRRLRRPVMSPADAGGL